MPTTGSTAVKGTILITRCELQKVEGEAEFCHYILYIY